MFTNDYSLTQPIAFNHVSLTRTHKGPALIKDNQFNEQQLQQQVGAGKNAAIDTLKQWCFASQMGQQELTASFKKLVNVIKSSPTDRATESAVMGERICQGAIVQKSAQSGETVSPSGADALAHELIKDVYMDALISCKSRDCTQQLIKIINSNQVDTIRASYYMTRIAVTEKDSIKDEGEIKQLVESFITDSQSGQPSEAIERQKLFAATSLVGKLIKQKSQDVSSIKPTVEQLCQTIVERFIKPVGVPEVQQYQQQATAKPELAKKIAQRNAALRALANIPGHVLKEIPIVDEVLMQIASNKQELVIARQSAIECLEQNDKAHQLLKQLTFEQSEPIEVRIAAYRALMTTAFAAEKKDEQSKQQLASQIVGEIVKHCEQERNQQQDDQFVLYAISHLDNVRTSQQPEHAAIKEAIAKNKQHYMQIQVLCKKFSEQLSDVRRSSRNYKLEQEFNQLESGLVLEGDLIYESKYNSQRKQQQANILPKLIRVNMSMPVMGETVNVIEITLRQDNMDEELLSALKMVQDTKFSSGSVSKVVDSFKSSVEKQQQQQQQTEQEPVEADLTIKVDGCTIVYLCVDDFKSSTGGQRSHQRSPRSIYSRSIVDDVIEYLKREPVAFNRGFNFNINERIAKVLDVDANMNAGLRFESRATGQSSSDFEMVVRMEPRFGFEAIVGPAKMSAKKLLQRVSTKTAIGARLRFKKNELVDVQIDLPMNTMDLFTFESQIVEKSQTMPGSYSYLPESIYGQEDIYTSSPVIYRNTNTLVKRSIFTENKKSTFGKLMARKTVAGSLETSDKVARATGLRGKLNYAVSPKDMSVIVSAQVQKYEPTMQGYRMQVQKSGPSQYLVSVSTPGSRVDRSMQVRVVKQFDSQRSVLKAEVKSARMSAGFACELVHDGRQYAIKSELVSHQKQWRHVFEAGVLRSASTGASGRLATAAYKPYVNIESSALRRPIQMQGTVSYQQAPKTVISYEFKCPTSGDFVQGKLIAEQRDNSASYAMRKRSAPVRRSMQSPLELALSKDATLTSEIVGRLFDQAVKVHNMIDWDSAKMQAQTDLTYSHKNMRKSGSQESTFVASVKINPEQQMFSCERKCPQQERKEFRVTVASMCKVSAHELSAEVVYNGRSKSVATYKHKVDVRKIAAGKYDSSVQIELFDNLHQINEKLQGRARIASDRKTKAVQCEVSSRDKSAKVSVDFESLAHHQIVVALQSARLSHKTEMRANQRVFSFQSRTDKQGSPIAKLIAELNKQQDECQIVVELPTCRSHYAADIKFAPSKVSSLAVQTPRFATKAEFSFDKMMQSRMPSSFFGNYLRNSPLSKTNLRFKTNVKDLINKEAYWMDSAMNVADWDKQSSFVRVDSPVYRAEVEFEPREWSTKIGAFARSKRSINNYDSIYSTRDSLISALALDSNKLNLGASKLWMLRSIIGSPAAMDSLKQKARRALFEYADRNVQHKHSLNWSPADERYTFELDHSPNTEFGGASWSPLRMKTDLSTSLYKPSTMSFNSDSMDFSVEAKPFYADDDLSDDLSYAKVVALSRSPRSAFKSHESEWRHKRGEGHKAHMKHVDSRNKQHQLRLHADEEPKKWAKLEMESDKHGKSNWEYNWRKHVTKRADDQEDVYANKWSMSHKSVDNKNTDKNWEHEHTLEWDEPLRMTATERRRDNKNTYANSEKRFGMSPLSLFDTTDRMRFNSLTRKPRSVDQADLYKVDFDYQPQQNSARLNINLPEDLIHSSSVTFKPSERLYKLQSKLYNGRTQEQIYDLFAGNKNLVAGLATADQEPVFVQYDHKMLEQPITNRLAKNLFRQPMKLDYSDKYGRIANVDYDVSPIVADSLIASKYAGLRQKRAALFYKNQDSDFEHSSTYDFYPETLFGKVKPSYRPTVGRNGDIVVKASTKYGPIVLRTDTSYGNTVEFELESPVVSGKLSAEMPRGSDNKLIKFEIDNKSARVELWKLVREIPMLADCRLVKQIVKKFDSCRFEHETEVLVSVVDAIAKIKSSTLINERPVVVIDGEWNKQQEKAFVKINGERVHGQAVVDLVRKSAELVLDVDDKRTLQHVTRLVRTSDKFYSLESVTSHKSKPLFKLSGKVSAKIFEEPSHLFETSRRRSSSYSSPDEHMSTFEAIVYEPTEYQVSAQYDCYRKEARVVVKNVEEKKFQETIVKFDEPSESIVLNARLSSPYGQVYSTQAKMSLVGLMEPSKCLRRENASACKSEIVYSDEQGNKWGGQYLPGEFISMQTPRGKHTFNVPMYVY